MKKRKPPTFLDLTKGEIEKKAAADFFGFDARKTTLLVLGGSLGARRINQLIEEKLSFFAAFDLQVIWQCGKLYYEGYKKHESDTIKVRAFLNRMDYAYEMADMVISRAGAASVSELCIVGKPVIFIPSPNVAEDHQTKNAKALVAKNAALMVKEENLEGEFESVFSDLYLSKSKQDNLMGNIEKLAMPNATGKIVDEIEKLL